jgi:protoporphyrinogen oxidase
LAHFVVAGAGVAGLTIARQLAVAGHKVTVIEKLDVVGGLGRSWHYGDFHFDVGPHRFHTENPRVARFVSETLGEDGFEIPRSSGVRMFGGFHEWPLRPSVLFAMPFSLMVRGAFDLIRREKMDGESFEADIVNKYGRTLYSIFFEPYTKKFLFHSPTDLHRDWGRAGVNRAVIDKRASADTLWSLLRNTLMPKPVETMFLYAPQGVGLFSEKLAAEIRAKGNDVLLGQTITGIETRGSRVTAVTTPEMRVACDGLIWTGPITEANQMLGLGEFPLKYLSTIFYNLEINAPSKFAFQWTYFGGNEIFSRLSTPTAFSPTMAPAGKHGLCVEVTCLQGDERWQHPERLVDAVIADLVKSETIDRADQVMNVHIERVPNTYPIYTLDYLKTLNANLRAIQQFDNLLLAGRSGRFWYNNMDHSIGQGLTMADKILRGDMLGSVEDADREFWNEAPAAAAQGTHAPVPVPVPVPVAVPVPVQVPVPVPVPVQQTAGAGGGFPWLAGGALAAGIAGLATWFGGGLGGFAYLLLYLAATAPGLPIGFRLFGRNHAAGWTAGALIGYAMTAFTLWAVIAMGAAGSAGFALGWLAVTSVSWGLARRSTSAPPWVPLPAWRRRDTLALLLTLTIVPALIVPTFRNLGREDGSGNRYYRAYFTADVLWHTALTAELAKFEMPPRDPYVADQPLNYYWSHFLLPASAVGTNPAGLWPRPLPILKVNALLSGLLFIGAIAAFVWSLVPRAWSMFAGVALSLLAASLEGSYAMYDLLRRGRELDALRYLNIDAITAWNFRSLTIDGLPRSIWYTPQHAMACALGVLALMIAGRARSPLGWRAVVAAGAMLGGAVMMSPFLGGVFAVIYGVTVAITLDGGIFAWTRRSFMHAMAAVPVAAAVAWCALNKNFDGAGSAIAFGFGGPIRQAPLVTPLLALGPLLAAAICGLWVRRRMAGVHLTVAMAAIVVGFGLFYFVTLPGGDLVWVGWRAGQILLVALPALAAIWFAWAFESRARRVVGVASALLLFALGLPTTVIDAYNAQDVRNLRMGPGFRWTVVVPAAQRRAAAWIRQETRKDAVVQMSPVPRGRETWTFIPTFAERRMAAGLPISLLKKRIYEDRSQRVHHMFGAADVHEAWRIADELDIDYIYLDSVEAMTYGPALDKFENASRFRRVFADTDVKIYEVKR